MTFYELNSFLTFGGEGKRDGARLEERRKE
jgi:hypothetical protein